MAEYIKEITREGEIVDIYQTGRLLGTGGFAKVYEVICLRTSQRYALKTISKHTVSEHKAHQKLIQEIKIHKKLKHKNIVKLQKVFDDEQNVYLLMELCGNETLKQLQHRRSRLTEFEGRYYLLQIISALEYLHSNRILHRDIKLGNVLINERMQVKMADFGLSVRLKDGDEKRRTTCGTPNYIAPEILSEQGHSFGVDVWAVGIIAYALLVGKPPFERDTVEETYEAIQGVEYKFPLSVPISSEAKHFIQSVIKLNPADRPLLHELKQHPFLSNQQKILPLALPKELLKDPPTSKLLKQYNSEETLEIAVVPRRLSTISRQSSAEIELREKVLKLKKSTSFHHISLKHSKSSENPTVNKIPTITSPRIKNINSSRTKHSISQSKSKITLSKSIASNKEQDDDIISYLDWAEKYGVGYILSSGVVGIVFNDKTSLARCRNIYYYLSRENVEYQYQEKQIPVGVYKKFKILKQVESQFKPVKGPKVHKKHVVYIKRYLRRGDTFIMKSSNDLCYFIWDTCSIRLKNYKEVKWRLKGGEQGYGDIRSQFKNKVVEEKVLTIKSILLEMTIGES